MKKTPIYIFTVVYAFITLWAACSGSGGNTTAEPEATASANNDTCQIDPAGFEIPKDTADVWMTNWKNMGVTLPGKGDTVFLGFHIPQCELQSMVSTLNDSLQVWAMLAMEGTGSSAEFKLVFMAQTGNPRNPYDYFDFTLPCPTTCPPDK